MPSLVVDRWARAAMVSLAVAGVPSLTSAQTRPIGPFTRGTIGVELDAGAMREMWSVNESREHLAGGTLAIWWAFKDGATLVAAFDATMVFQATPRRAFVNGLSPILRWRLVDRPSWSLFGEIGGGISWSDTSVPPRGTRLNYLGQIGGGIMRPLSTHAHFIAAVRGTHISNNDRDGRRHNPDIEALGGYAGIAIGF
jgi:lipid A 3-O-deacylase PagL